MAGGARDRGSDAVSQGWHGRCLSRREATCVVHADTTMESILGIHEAALLFRAQRMEVLAANLANADTPHYKARDIEFALGARRRRERG